MTFTHTESERLTPEQTCTHELYKQTQNMTTYLSCQVVGISHSRSCVGSQLVPGTPPRPTFNPVSLKGIKGQSLAATLVPKVSVLGPSREVSAPPNGDTGYLVREHVPQHER